jgi:uncharacterized membrane protein SpoIIM required for sporulation
MTIPCNSPRYFTLAAFLLFFGIMITVIQAAAIHYNTPIPDRAALEARAEYHSGTVVPYMAGVFPRLLFSNAGVALFLLMVPLFWVWIWWLRHDLLEPVVLLMQVTTGILLVALGHNSFARAYLTAHLLSGQMLAIMYLPHGIFEMLAFILAGTTAFITIDALKRYLQMADRTPDLNPGDLCLEIFSRTWRSGLMIFVLLIIAAAIECWVTPHLVASAFSVLLQQSSS